MGITNFYLFLRCGRIHNFSRTLSGSFVTDGLIELAFELACDISDLFMLHPILPNPWLTRSTSFQCSYSLRSTDSHHKLLRLFLHLVVA